MNKQMEKQLYAMIECLADNYGFDADEAFNFVRDGDIDHIGELLKMVETKKVEPKKVVKDDASEAGTESSGSDVGEKIATCKKNIALWEKKLAEGKVADADKQREKITKEKAKLTKLEAKAPAPVKVVETKTATKVEPKVEKEKRIKRFSPTMASQLKSAVEGAGVEMSDKLKKEFQQYIEDLSEDDYRNSGLGDHMRAFAKAKSPKVVETTEESESEEETLPVEISEAKTVPTEVSGGAGAVTALTLDELHAIKTIATVNPVGNFWDADNGRFVSGPAQDEDEDFTDEFDFDGKKFIIGEKTGRVYEVRDSGDVFAGFVGVGKFKGMKMP
jgi:hypothetical protein